MILALKASHTHFIPPLGALKLDHLEYIVLDGTYKDQKQRTLFDIPELKGDLLKLLQILHKDVPQVRFCIYH